MRREKRKKVSFGGRKGKVREAVGACSWRPSFGKTKKRRKKNCFLYKHNRIVDYKPPAAPAAAGLCRPVAFAFFSNKRVISLFGLSIGLTNLGHGLRTSIKPPCGSFDKGFVLPLPRCSQVAFSVFARQMPAKKRARPSDSSVQTDLEEKEAQSQLQQNSTSVVSTGSERAGAPVADQEESSLAFTLEEEPSKEVGAATGRKKRIVHYSDVRPGRRAATFLP